MRCTNRLELLSTVFHSNVSGTVCFCKRQRSSISVSKTRRTTRKWNIRWMNRTAQFILERLTLAIFNSCQSPFPIQNSAMLQGYLGQGRRLFNAAKQLLKVGKFNIHTVQSGGRCHLLNELFLEESAAESFYRCRQEWGWNSHQQQKSASWSSAAAGNGSRRKHHDGNISNFQTISSVTEKGFRKCDVAMFQWFFLTAKSRQRFTCRVAKKEFWLFSSSCWICFVVRRTTTNESRFPPLDSEILEQMCILSF